MPYIGTPPARRILSSSDIEQGAVTLDDINFTDVPANMDISGTIDKHTMRLADGVTITGDVTISEDLVLAKLSDDGDAITMTPDSTTRTITGSGSIQAATVVQTPQPTQTYAVGTTLTGLTGVIGSEVTGGAGLSTSVDNNSITLAKMAANSVDSDQYVDGSIDTAHIADDQVTLAKMAGGTDGQIITYDANGNPIAVGPGTDGQVLTSTGAGSPPAFEDASGGGSSSAGDGAFAAGFDSYGWVDTQGGGTVIVFNDDSSNDLFDTDSRYNTSDGKYTAPANGVYLFWYAMLCAHNTQSNSFSFKKNGTILDLHGVSNANQVPSTDMTYSEGSDADVKHNATVILPLNSGDYIQVCVGVTTTDYLKGKCQWGGCRLK